MTPARDTPKKRPRSEALPLPATSDLTVGQAFAFAGMGYDMPVSGDARRVVES